MTAGLGWAADALLLAWMAQAVGTTLLCLWYLRLLDRRQPWPREAPPVLVLVPVRGAPPGLTAFLDGLPVQDYRGAWRVAFAVESREDPAHAVLLAFAASRSEERRVG